jgi:sterol desaturase/sphingolipid hydroxylase (fatty acid hydroxylase superfamily)
MSNSVALWSWLSPTLIVGGALTLIALERCIPHTPGQRLLRDGFWSDLLGYALIQSYFLAQLIAHLVAAVDRATGLSRRHLIGAWCLPAQVAFFVVSHDLYIYLFHRLQHRWGWLWRIHEAHHATADLDWLSGARSHALEILVNQTIELMPIVLLGAAPEVVVIKVTLDALWGMYIHSNLDVGSGRLQWVINGPEMHRWHHAIEIRGGVNFATKFALWDWLLGTAHRPASKPSGYGIRESFPTGFLSQQVHAFAPRPAPQSSISHPAPESVAPM